MAKRAAYSSRRRRKGNGGGGVLYRILSALLIFVCVTTALTMFFRVRTVTVTGLERYTEEDLLDAAGVKVGDNLFFLNKAEMSRRIIRDLPYIEWLHIRRSYPDRLLIEARECGTPLAAAQDGVVWLVSPSGKIVERTEDARGYGTITGCPLLSPSVGTQIALPAEYAARQDSLLALLSALADAGILQDVNAIRLDDPVCIRMEYDGRLTVKLPYGADYAYKLRALEAYLETGVVQEGTVGTFDMTKEEKNYFQPGVQ